MRSIKKLFNCSLRQPLRFRRHVAQQYFLKISLNENFQPVFKTFKKFESYIDNRLSLPYSNGPMGRANTHIKVLKRIAYGYRNFTNFRNRIFLVLVTAKTIQQNQLVIQNFKRCT
ncbi:transposase [Lactovum miscens]|uniref:transposase n=1 Tax=Lactovum miscens TaxID=190387 RepID=UPI0039C9AFA3